MQSSRRTGALLGLLCLGLIATPALAGVGAEAGPERPTGSYDETRLLIAFDPGTPGEARRAAHAVEGARVENTIANLNLDVVKLRDGQDAVQVAARYERNPNVAYTDFNHKVGLLSNDSLYKDQWGLHNIAQPVTGSFVRGVVDADVDAPEGWAAAFPAGIESSGGTLTGILDTGIDRSHVDLLNRAVVCATANAATGIVVEGTCSDDNLHGTHVAGTVAALTNNGVGVAGVAPNAPLAIFKGLNGAGTGFYADIVAGIDYLSAKKGVPIISMSIGGPKDDALDRVLSQAWARGTLLIAAAGNDGDATANYPAFHPDVMSVGSIDQAGQRSSFSNCNNDVEIAAPGEDIWSTFPGNSYGVISGTSMATPHVSGVAAMLMSEKGLTATQTRSTLKSTALGSGGCNNIGVVNLANALGASGGGTVTPPPPTGTGTIAGTVTTSGKNPTVISGATVACGAGGSATTGTDGRYTIASVAAGSYTCTASAPNRTSKSASVTVTSGQTTTQNYALR